MKTALTLVAILGCSFQANADWPRLRGAKGDGIGEGKVPVTWSAGEHIAWKANLPGPGSSSPIIVGDRVFITCWSGYGDGSNGTMDKLKRHLLCLNNADGKILWDKTMPALQPEDEYAGFITEHGYASNTPTSDGISVFVFFGKSGALAFDFDGKQLWQTSLGMNSNSRRWGSAASPILYKDTVIVTAMDEGGAVVALDKKTGKQVWRAPAEGLELVYSTPVLAGEDLLLPVANELWGFNPDNGKLRWYATHELPGNVSPGVAVGPDAVYVTGGFPKRGTVAIKLGGSGDITKNVLWSATNASYVPSPILHEGHLYVIDDQGFALCINAKTGDGVYRERVMESGAGGGNRRGGGKPFYASPVLVDGKLYCPSRKNGTFVLAAKPTYEKLAVNILSDDDSQFNATPAVDGNKLYLRSDKVLYCIGE